MNRYKSIYLVLLFSILLLFFTLAGCDKTLIEENALAVPSKQDVITITLTQTRTILPTKTPLPHSSTLTTTITPMETTESFGCKEPSDNYDPIEINGHKLNKRTFEMLQTAKRIYDGVIDITGEAITQGSYTNAVEASFGTHAGGGAVDLSVMSPGTYMILLEDIEPLIRALRLAGFAAWYRDLDDLYDGSPAHIHAIAIGDRTLSLAAREQLAGPFGYFWGYDGLPREDKIPTRDPHGGPIVCDWMIQKGYPNKTATPSLEEQTP